MPFICYDVSLQLIRALSPIYRVMKRENSELAEQMRDAANSITLNLGEGGGCGGGRRRLHNEIAHGSAKEVKGCVDAGEAWGWLDGRAIFPVLERQLALLWGLTHGRWVQTLHGKPIKRRR